MTRTPRFLSALVVLLLGAANLWPVPLAPGGKGPSAAWAAKVDPWVLETAAGGETEFIVFLREQADLSPAAGLPTKIEKGTYVYETLAGLAASTQGPVLAALAAVGAVYRAYWVANMVWVRGDETVVQAMAGRADVAHVYANPVVRLDLPEAGPANTPEGPDNTEWNIDLVNAPDVWAAGYTGQGAVIAGQDTGYDWDHPALINQYRGWDGGSADHNYSWHDAIHSGGGICGADSTEPCDDHGHGTHTMGTMVGDDGGTNQIGMAPGAKWIGCRNMDQGVGTPTTYSECYQWFIAPTNLNGANPDPAMAPDVINNSWSCPPSEGCTDPNVLRTVVQNVRAAGILTAHSAGNSGPSCSTVNDPAAIYGESFTVGATDILDNIASFSSRGPVTVDGSNRLKPEISAPGVSVRSSLPGVGYQILSGTSMAAPHVAGLVGLLVSAQPALAGQVDTLEALIESTAVPRTTAQTCGGVPGSQVPNNTYGWGRIDTWQAFQMVHRILLDKKTSPTVLPGETLTYTLSLTHSHLVSATTGVILTDSVSAGTVFITATQPYTLTGGVVRWDFPSMAAGEVQEVEMVVSIPLTATESVVNNSYSVQSDDVAPVFGAPITTTLLLPELAFSAGQDVFAKAGDVVRYNHTLTNSGNYTATLGVNIVSTRGWSSFEVPESSLGPGQAVTVAVTVTVPLTATSGMADITTLTAVSTNAPEVSVSVTDTTVVPYQAYLPLVPKP